MATGTGCGQPVPDTGEAQARRTLFDAPGVGVVDFRCRAHVEPAGPEEPSLGHAIALVRRGVFRRTLRGEDLVADANHVLFFNAGEPCRYAHPIPGGDDCTLLVVDGERALELVRWHAVRDAERPDAPFRLGHGLASARAARLHYELLRLIAERPPGLVVEDAAAELADEVVGAAYQACGTVPPSGVGSVPRTRQRELVEAAKVVLNQRLESLPSLSALAGELGCSPFHFSRTFHRAAGVRLRAYVARLRARRAAELLAAGARDLSALALRLGYADHSHLTRAFQAEWGVPPARFRSLRSGVRPASNAVQAARPLGH